MWSIVVIELKKDIGKLTMAQKYETIYRQVFFQNGPLGFHSFLVIGS